MWRIKVNRKGATRIVFETKDFVVKIPRIDSWKCFLTGLLANLQEREFSKTNWAELCPVRFADPLGIFVVMPFAEALDKDFFYESFDYESFVNKQDYFVPVENKVDSFGLLDGHLVAIDYGS